MVMPMRELKAEKAESGFTLIEVMIAMALFAMGIGALYAMQYTSVKGNLNANQQTSSVIAGTEVVEVLMSMPYNDPVFTEMVGGIRVVHTDAELTGNSALKMRVVAPYINNIQWTVTDLSDENGTGVVVDEKLIGTRRVSVTVTYREGRRQVNLDFLRIAMMP